MSDKAVMWLLFIALIAILIAGITLYMDYHYLWNNYITLMEYVNESCTCYGMYLK